MAKKEFNAFGSEMYVFCETSTKECIVNEDHLKSLGIKESTEGLPLFGMPAFWPLKTILSASFDAVELLYSNVKNELQTVLGVRKGNRCGLINMLGVQILPLEYSRIITPINSKEPIFCVQRAADHKWAAISLYGKEIIPFGTYKYMWGYDHNHCLVSTIGGVYSGRAIVGLDGEFLVSPGEYLDIYSFRGKDTFQVEDINHNTFELYTESLEKVKVDESSYTYDNDPYYGYDDEPGWGSYDEYGGYNGYDDYTIDSAFDGDPEATWNID